MPDAPRWLDREALARHICVRPGAVSRDIGKWLAKSPTIFMAPRKWFRNKKTPASQ